MTAARVRWEHIRNSSGSLAIFAAIRRASSRVSCPFARGRSSRPSRIRVDIRNLYETSFEYRASRRASPTWRCGIRAPVHLEHLGCKAVVRHEVEELAVKPVHKAELAIAEPPSALGNHIEDRVGVGRGAADDLEHVGGSNLLLTRLVQLSSAIVELLPQVGERLAAGRGYLRTVSLRLSDLATPSFHRFTACGAIPPHLA